mgnify:CR=1 FL=1
MSPHNGEGHGQDESGYDDPTGDSEEYAQDTDGRTGFDRRSFLKFAGVATAGLAASGLSGTAAGAPTRDSFSFDRVVNAVDDLGMDPNGNTPIDGALDGAIESGTLIQFPPGEYYYTESHSWDGVSNAGISGTGDSQRDVVFRPEQGQQIRLVQGDVENFLLENVSFQQYDDKSTLPWLWIRSDGGSLLRDIEWLGKTGLDQYMDVGSTYVLTYETTSESGVNVAENLIIGEDAPAHESSYPHGTQVMRGGGGHVGELVLRDLRFVEQNSNPVRYTHPSGVLTIEGGEFVNNTHTSLRVSAGRHPSKRTVVDGAHIRVDKDWGDLRGGLICDSSNNGDAGMLIENTTIEWDVNHGEVIEFPDWGGHGAVTFRDCIVRNDGGSATIAADATSDTNDDAITVENCSFTGSGGGFVAEDRDGSVIRDSCIGMSDVTIRGFETENVGSSGCRTPGDGTDGDTASDTDASTDETTDLPNTLVVQGTGTATRYAFTVSEELQPVTSTIESHDTVDGRTVEAWVTEPEHVDEFAFAGSVTAFEYLEGGPVELTLNGESVAPEDLVDTNDGPTAEVTVTGTDGLTAELSAEDSTDPDGSIAAYEWEVGEETDTGATTTHTFGDAGTYSVSLTVSDDDGASDTTTADVSVSDGHELRIQGAGTPTQVVVEVSGELTAVEDTIEPWDEVTASSATVWVTDTEDVDRFTFTGELTGLEFLQGEAAVSVDGSAVSPSDV